MIDPSEVQSPAVGTRGCRCRRYVRLVVRRSVRAAWRGGILVASCVAAIMAVLIAAATLLRFPALESWRAPGPIGPALLLAGVCGVLGAWGWGGLAASLAMRAVGKRRPGRLTPDAFVRWNRWRRILGIASVVLPLLAAGLWFGWREHRSIRLAAQLRGRCTESMTGMIRDFFFVHDRMPESYEEFRRSRLAPLTPIEVDANWALGRRGDPPDAISKQVFPAALAASRNLASAWADEANGMRRRLLDREGNLKAQLDLFLDPRFEPLVATSFLETLQKRKGVDRDTLSEFIEANREMRSIHAFLTGSNALPPELAPVDNAKELAAIFRSRQEKRYQEVRQLIEERRDEILTDMEEVED